jgi:cyclopropane fatty-acyl-phospholipid synthase-like methyltransferase
MERIELVKVYGNALNAHFDLSNLKGKLGLDIGCGWGWLIRYLLDLQVYVLGFDVSRASVVKARNL